MLLLEELRVELERQRTQQDYLERGVLKSLKLWLDPQDTEAKTFKASAATFLMPRTHTHTHTRCDLSYAKV